MSEPTPTSPHESNKNSPTARPERPAAFGFKSGLSGLYPGRVVSVQYGPFPPDAAPTSCSQVRVFALLNPTVSYELTSQTPEGEMRTTRIEGTRVTVVGARMLHMLQWPLEEHVVSLLLELRFVHETAKSEVQGITSGDLNELGERDALIAQLGEAFRTLSRGERRPTAHYVEGIGMVFATHILHSLFDGEAPPDRRGGLPIDSLQRVITYIDGHYNDEYDADVLARIAGFSRNHFYRLFAKSLNQSPREYWRRCQVERAIALLQTTDMKMIDIAQACRFCDETQMARWFWKLRDILPSEVRDAARR